MGILDKLEDGLERAVNGAFARTFRSGVQPVEIAAALRRELDTEAAIVSRDRILAPNTFIVSLSETDFARMNRIGDALIDELVIEITQHAEKQNYHFAGGVSVDLANDLNLREGQLHIESSSVKGNVSWDPVLEIDGRRYPIEHARTVLGRGSEADIALKDSGASRKHAEFRWDGRNAEVRDLGSTNGTRVGGKRIRSIALAPDDSFEIGSTTIRFRVVPQAHKSAKTGTVPRRMTRAEATLPRERAAEGPHSYGRKPEAPRDGFWA